MTHEGVSLVPSAAKPRVVLALLAMRAGDVLPADLLIEELWLESVPRNAKTVLQTYVVALRKMIDLACRRTGEAKRLLRTVGSGYLLDVPAERVDHLAFEKLVGEGYQAHRAQDVERSARLFRQALGHWRGTPFGDVQVGPSLGAEGRRLEEVRLNALDCRIDADVKLGRHHELLGELAYLTERHPTHERLAAHLMLALYRSGRRSEALDAYRRVCQDLMTEAGLDPSPALRRLHRSMVTADRRITESGGGHRGALKRPEAAAVGPGAGRRHGTERPMVISPELAVIPWEVQSESG